MKKVYICSPCRGDYENNIQRAKEFSRAPTHFDATPEADLSAPLDVADDLPF